ncbi:hypothetical protein K474DRAFT_1582155, partial [Panus rudis PR-1116 ss-1]
NPYPPVRRVITGHNKEGKSVVIRDEPIKPIYWTPTDLCPSYDIYRTNEHPAVVDTELTQGEWVDDIAQDPTVFSENGSTFRSIDTPPGNVVALHRTLSIDYAIVTKGSVVLELDDGKRVTLNAGDVAVQRGTLHGWRNESTEWSRTFFVAL